MHEKYREGLKKTYKERWGGFVGMREAFEVGVG